jgi:hypothetical protein
MNELIHNFIESLREELRQYGELLALHEVLSKQLPSRSVNASLDLASVVTLQADAVAATYRERAQRQRDLAQYLRLPPDSSIAALLPLLPETYRPLVEALFEECHQLRERARLIKVPRARGWRARHQVPPAARRNPVDARTRA